MFTGNQQAAVYDSAKKKEDIWQQKPDWDKDQS